MKACDVYLPFVDKCQDCEKSYNDSSLLRKQHRRHQKEDGTIFATEDEPIVILTMMGMNTNE